MAVARTELAAAERKLKQAKRVLAGHQALPTPPIYPPAQFYAQNRLDFAELGKPHLVRCMNEDGSTDVEGLRERIRLQLDADRPEENAYYDRWREHQDAGLDAENAVGDAECCVKCARARLAEAEVALERRARYRS